MGRVPHSPIIPVRQNCAPGLCQNSPRTSLYSALHLGLNGTQRRPTAVPKQEEHDAIVSSRIFHRNIGRVGRRDCSPEQRTRGIGAGQDFRAQAFALGAADASAAEGDGGMGRLGREGVERHHQVQDLPVTAARQGLRPLRHGARRHPRLHLRQSRLPARRLPDHLRGHVAVLVRRAKGGNLAVDAWYRKYAANEMKDTKYCFSFILDPLTWHSSKKKIQVPGDIKGISVRPSHATVGTWVTLLGGTNVQASATEVRDVIEKGVAEAVTFPWGSVPLLGVDKVTKYHMDAPLVTTTFQWLMSPRTYAAMSPAQKKVIDDHCTTEWAGKFADPWADFERAGLAKVKALPGHEVFTITDAQLNEWKKSAEPLEQKWADNVKKAGGDPDAIMKELKGSLTQYKAAY